MFYPQYQVFTRSASAILPPIAGKLDKTTSDIEGPFYKKDAPFRNELVEKPNFWVSGKVLNTDGEPVDAVIDYWQANEKGEYDLEGYNFRGKVKTEKGLYSFGTVKPGNYKISDTEYRCSHLHIKIWVEDKEVLTTQLYFSGSEHNDTDRWFNPERMLKGLRAGGTFDFVIELN